MYCRLCLSFHSASHSACDAATFFSAQVLTVTAPCFAYSLHTRYAQPCSATAYETQLVCLPTHLAS
jgi:hypothetical protein